MINFIHTNRLSTLPRGRGKTWKSPTFLLFLTFDPAPCSMTNHCTHTAINIVLFFKIVGINLWMVLICDSENIVL